MKYLILLTSTALLLSVGCSKNQEDEPPASTVNPPTSTSENPSVDRVKERQLVVQAPTPGTSRSKDPQKKNARHTLTAKNAGKLLNVGNTPFRYFKQYGHEGGARTHFIASGPGVVSSGGLCGEPAHIADLYPTFLELAGADYPETCSKGPVPPLDGTSMVPLFKGASRPAPEILISGLKRFRMVRMKDWKIVQANDGDWELYQIEEDPAEQKNLAEAMPEKVSTIEAAYKQWMDE